MKQNKLLKRKQQEDETISMWGIKVEGELRKMGVMEYTMCNTFAHDIRDAVVRKKMIKQLVVNSLTMVEAIKEVKRRLMMEDSMKRQGT